MASCLPNASPFFIILSMCLLISTSEAEKHVVGGTENSWKFPLSNPDSLTHWANSHQFKIGDTLIFKYEKRRESVHEVNKMDYEGCKTVGKDHVVFKDGNTEVMLTKSGFRYFISGNQNHCNMGLKLSVNVIVTSSNITKNNIHSQSPSPSPSPSPSLSLLPSPPSSPSPPPSLLPSPPSSTLPPPSLLPSPPSPSLLPSPPSPSPLPLPLPSLLPLHRHHHHHHLQVVKVLLLLQALDSSGLSSYGWELSCYWFNILLVLYLLAN